MTVWKIGCLLYTLTFGETPFKNIDDISNAEFVVFLRKEVRHLKSSGFETLYDLIISMLDPCPKFRISIDDIANHSFWKERYPQ